MELILLVLSVGLLLLHGLALVWLWQLRRKMNIPAKRDEGAEAITTTPREVNDAAHDEAHWFVSDAEQAMRERELVRASGKRVTEGEPWTRRH